MVRRFLSSLPLTDRITFSYEMWAAAAYGVFAGLGLPLITIMARKIGISVEGIMVMTTMQFVGAIFGILAGRLSDRLPPMSVYAWPTAVSRALIALLAFTRTPVGFFTVASLFYLVANLVGPPFARIMRSNYSDKNRARLMSILRIGVCVINTAVSAFVVLAIADETVYRWLFPVAAVFGMLSVVIFSRIKVRKIPGLPHKSAPVSFRGSVSVVGKNTAFVLFMGILMLCAGPDKLLIPIEPFRFSDELGITYRQVFILNLITTFFSIVGYYAWAKTLKRSNPFAVVFIVTILGAARTAVIAAAAQVPHLMPSAVFLGLANAGWDIAPLFCIIALADPENFSLYFGFHTTLVGIRGLVGPAVGTLLHSSGAMSASGIYWIVTVLTLAGGFSLAWFTRRLKRQSIITR